MKLQQRNMKYYRRGECFGDFYFHACDSEREWQRHYMSICLQNEGYNALWLSKAVGHWD
jgi:hypothetical protein